MYREARLKTIQTGIPHVVDHVIALVLGGLHAAGNLQVITATQNRAKEITDQATARAWATRRAKGARP